MTWRSLVHSTQEKPEDMGKPTPSGSCFLGSGLLAHDIIREATRGERSGERLFLLTFPYSLYHSTVEADDHSRDGVATKPAVWALGWDC